MPASEWLEAYLQLARLHRLLSLWQQGGVRAEKSEIEGGGSKNNLPEIRWYEAVHMNDGWSYNVLLMTGFYESVEVLCCQTQMA